MQCNLLQKLEKILNPIATTFISYYSQFTKYQNYLDCRGIVFLYPINGSLTATHLKIQSQNDFGNH